VRPILFVLLAAGTAAADPVLEGTGDVDGKPGDEVLRLDADGTLHAGTASIVVPLDSAHPAFDRKRKLAAIALGGSRRGVLLAMPTEGDEDPSNRTRVFLYTKGALRLVFDQVGPDPTFDARGIGRYLESPYDACTRGSKPGQTALPKVRLDQLTLRLDKSGTKLVSSRSRSKEVFDCNELSACPFVYELDGTAEPQLAGEILRDLRGRAAYAWQSLALAMQGAGTIRVRLAEEKPEVTYLDEVYVVVGGKRVDPKACASAPAPAYCAADQRPYVMRQGDVLDLELDVPAGARTLEARGYYVPR
jgi:hypothetical protein